jgi:hypothetical protein
MLHNRLLVSAGCILFPSLEIPMEAAKRKLYRRETRLTPWQPKGMGKINSGKSC